MVPLERAVQPLDAAAPPSRFNVPDGEALWNAAWDRASKPSPEQGVGYFDLGELVGEGFRSAKVFRCEKFKEGVSGSELAFTLTADEAVKEEDQLKLANMHLVYFSQPDSAAKQDKQEKERAQPEQPKTGPAEKKVPAAPEPRAKKDVQSSAAAGPPANVPAAFRVLVSAPSAVIDVKTKEGRASGQVTVEVFQLLPAAAGQTSLSNTPFAVLKTERLAWRTWYEPRDGSTELAVYTGSTKPGEPEPEVFGHYIIPQPDGTNSTLDVQGRGLVYEVGTYERPMPKEDEDGRTAGVSTTAHNQAMYHHAVKLVTTASGMQALAPGPGGLPPPNAPPKEADKPAAPAAPSETTVLCAGPAVLNLAAVPRATAGGTPAVRTAAVSAAETNKPLPVEQASGLPGNAGKRPAPQAEEAARQAKAAPGVSPIEGAKQSQSESGLPAPVQLARRFEFYNGVSARQRPLRPPEKAGAPAGVHSDLSCQHLCLQYPAGVVPGPATFPEYAEALEAVKMSGARLAEPTSGDAGPPRLVPYAVDCERVLYEGPKDSTFLVGSAAAPARVKDETGEAFAQEFCYVRSTETLTMPSRGPKKMVIKAAEPPAPAGGSTGVPPASSGSKPAGAISLGAGSTIIVWRGPLSREVRHLPVPQQHDRIKEVLVFKEDVVIEQPGGGLQMRGQTIRVVRNMPVRGGPAGDVEFLEGRGGVEALMEDLHALGETITVEMGYGKDGALTQDLITVTGSREKAAKATLFKAGSAMRSEKFIIDRLADTFRSFGGAVAVVKSPPQEAPAAQKPQAAQDAGAMFKGISFQGGGDLFLQCDGEFSQDAARRVTLKENALIRQTQSGGAYSELLADEFHLALADPAPASTAGVPPASVSAGQTPAVRAASAPGAPAHAFFSGDFKSLEGLGHVEIRSPEQLVQCDKLTYDKEKDVSLMEVDDPENDVRVYMSEASGGTRILSARKSLQVDGSSGKFTPGGSLVMLPYRARVPAPRDKESSPARKRKP